MKRFEKDVHITANEPKNSSGLPDRTTNRLRIDSWEKSNRPNKRAGDAIAIHWMKPDAKGFIGWWDATDPDNPVCKAWMGAHDEANNPESAPHRHFSIEVTDASGQMQTRFAIPYDKEHTNIITSKADFTVRGGTLRIPRNSTLDFSTDKDGARGPVWQVRTSSSGALELLHSETPDFPPEPVASVDPVSKRLELESLNAAELVLKDQSTGRPHRVFIEDGELRVEEL